MIDVPLLAPFEKSDWNAMESAFQHAPVLPFRQAWLHAPEEEFRGGEARLGWREGSFYVFARLQDDHIFTAATADQQRLWMLGDVMEIFLRDCAQEDYWELHVSPGGHRMQLHLPSAEAITRMRKREITLEDCLVAEPVFYPAARVVPGGWEVFAEVKTNPFAAGHRLLVSVSRYDYRDADTRPVLSSTSAHKVLNYHRQEEWQEVRLAG